MTDKILTKIALFKGKKIRRIWDNKQEKWYFSVIDVVQILINQSNYQSARNYWKVLKNRLNKEGSQVVTKCNRLKMQLGLYQMMKLAQKAGE